jgi:SAM-dependent methyltransferase
VNKVRGILRRQIVHEIVRERLDSFVATYRTNECILDLGCGNSHYTKYFPNRIAFDITKKDGVEIVGDAHHLPFRPDVFSMVLSTEMLEHVREPQRIIDEIKRVLKPGGMLVLTTRFIFPLHDTPYDFYRFTQYGLEYLFREWVQLRITPEVGSVQTLGVLLQRLAFQCEFYGSRSVRIILFLVARLVGTFGRLIKVQYGDRAQTNPVNDILVSGWYVVAKKPTNNII